MTRGFTHAVAFHGFGDDEILIGGTALPTLKQELREKIEAAIGPGIRVRVATPANKFGGDNPCNIVNRLTAGGTGGIQIEQSLPAREDHWGKIRRGRRRLRRPPLRSRPGGAVPSPTMPSLEPALLQWAVRGAAPGADVTEVRGLRDGGSPWLVRLSRDGMERSVVLRVGTDPAPLRTEVAALQLAAEHHLPAPRLLAAELDGAVPVVLVEQVPGSSAIPPDRPSARLRTLGRTAATLHAIRLEPGPALPRRDRPIGSVDFAALRRQHPPNSLFTEAEQRMADPPPPIPGVFVHGDLRQGNALWTGGTLNGLIDWDCAGSGHPGIDLGSLRCDAAICFGPDAAPDIQQGWEEVAARPATDVPYWDVVAALSTPPDMGWFPSAIAGQGRPDLTQAVLLRRRDEFLNAALTRLDTPGG